MWTVTLALHPLDVVTTILALASIRPAVALSGQVACSPPPYTQGAIALAWQRGTNGVLLLRIALGLDVGELCGMACVGSLARATGRQS